MAHRIRVGLIFGGKSGEHEVSLASANSVARYIDATKYEVVQIGITKDGCWLSGGNPLKQLAKASPSPLLKADNSPNGTGNGVTETNSKYPVPVSAAALTASSPLANVDVAFPLVHGTFGEDGTIQGLLELADIPYVGAGVAASAVGMDKAMMKAVFASHDLPQVDWLAIARREWERDPEATLDRVQMRFGYPCFVKPANLGSSVGITKAHNRGELAAAFSTAALYDRKIIGEQSAIDAREIECSVLGNDDPIASIPGEVIPRREFYDYAAKYEEDSGTELIVPADLPDSVSQSIRDLAVRAFRAIDCSGMARVDFFVQRQSHRILVNEINTIPGFTSVSMYPRMWEKSGISYPVLIDRLIQLALERHNDRKRSKTTYS